MDIVRRDQASAVPVPGGVTCERCKRSLPRDAFAASSRLHDGLYPWCILCAGSAVGDAEVLLARRAAYQRSYMMRRREVGAHTDARVAWLTVVVPGRGKMLARWSAARASARITGGFSMKEEALRVLTSAFCVDVSEVVESGSGGGRGFRRQKTFSTTGPVTREAWDAGRALLLEAGAAREGKR